MPISSIVSKTVSPIYKQSGKFCNRFAKTKFVNNLLEDFYKNPGKAAGKMLLYSIVSKDAVNCILYTYQSWNNERIPKDKRKFVALGDLVNGIVMVGGQLLAGLAVNKALAPKIKSCYTGTIKNKNGKEITANNPKATSRVFHSDNIRVYLAEVLNKKGIEAKDVKVDEIIEKVAKQTKTPFVSGLGILITTLCATALIKRTLAPLISTPIAGIINDKFVKTKDEEKELPGVSPVAVSARYLNKKA